MLRATDEFATHHVEIFCLVIGTSATTGNTFESRASYTVNNIDFGHRFSDALVHNPTDNSLNVDLEHFSSTLLEDPSELFRPQCY